MSASFRLFSAAALAVVVLLALAPGEASAHIKGYGTLIEYAGSHNLPEHFLKIVQMEFMSIMGSGL